MRFSFVSLHIAIFLTLCVTGCSNDRHHAAAEPVADLSSLMRDYRAMPDSLRQDAVSRCLPEVTAFMKVVSGDTVSDSLLEAWSASPVVLRFTAAVDSVFPSQEFLQADLGYILSAARDEGLDLPHRRYAAVTYGRPEAVLFVDSVMLVALNHFLGSDFPGYGHWPLYRRQEKRPENLPYALSEAIIATRYPYEASPGQATLLSRMLYEGALAKAKLATVPDATVNAVLGCDKDEYAMLVEREGELWRQLVSSGLLYDTSHLSSERFNAPSPAVNVLASAWPARVGRFVGVQIVDSYLEHNPGTTLAQLLSPDFYNSPQALERSAYKAR